LGQGFIATTNRPSSTNDAHGAAFARYYDLDVEDERDDIEIYRALASASDGPVLELACGTGRICIPLAAAGHRVTGVDRDRFMLDRARETWRRRINDGAATPTGQLELVRGDITTLRLGQRFDLVILGFNSLLLLAGPGQRAAALATMSQHLNGDGRAVIDIAQPSDEDLQLYDGRVIEDWAKVDRATGDRVAKSTIATYDPSDRRAAIRTIYDIEPLSGPARRLERVDEIALVSRAQLRAELEVAGLQVQSELGDIGTTEPQVDRDRWTVIAALSVHPLHTSRTN
jgi:SAM-dependent methyltransferase